MDVAGLTEIKNKLFNYFIKMLHISHRFLRYDRFENILEKRADCLISNKHNHMAAGRYRRVTKRFPYWVMLDIDKHRQA